MKLKVAKGEVSRTPWGDVDKTRIRQVLAKALEDGAEGAADAVREVYAVVKGDNVADAPSENWWGPHHEIREDGSVVLNENGVIAAAQALAGARADPDLTPEQRRAAARHLLRHYRQDLKREPPVSLLQAAGERPAGELARVGGGAVTGEMRPSDIPAAAWANLDALKQGDPDPLEVVVRIPEGKSKRGWYYTRRVLERIAAEINTTGLPGILGHQDPEKVDREFVPPATHWIGARVQEEGGRAVLYARGLVDKAAEDLKRWIRGNAIRQVSIYGVPTLETTAGETRVVDFAPLSIDWTPLNRSGMPTAVVAVGEMDSIIGGDGTVDQLTWKDAAVALRRALEAKETTPAAVVGEMGLKLPEVAQALAADEWTKLQAAAQAVGEMAQVLGLKPDASTQEIVTAVKAAREAQQAAAKAQRDALLDKVIGEMVATEAVRPLVRRLVEPALAPGATEEQVRQAVGEVMAADDVRRALAAAFGDSIIRPAASNKDSEPAGLSVRRVAI